MVVMPHGGPHGIRDSWEFDPEVQLLASRGYAVLQVNYRGSGGYGMDFESAGYREWGAKMQDDITDATRWAIEQKIAPADRICIYGASYGGYRGVDERGARARSVPMRDRLRRRLRPRAHVPSPATFPTRAAARRIWNACSAPTSRGCATQSPAYNAQNIKVPVLLIHGKADWRADYEHAQAHARRAGEEPEESRVAGARAGEGHGIYDEETRREVYERILQFLDANLRTPPATASR